MLSGGGTWLQENTTKSGVRTGHGVLYAPELSSNLELGYKLFLPDSRSSINLALYQMDIKNYQHFYPDALAQTRVSSVERVRSEGVEASFETSLLDNLKATFGLGYNNAEVADVDGTTGATALTSLQAGDRVPNAPKYNANLQLSHDAPLQGSWRIRNNLSFNYFGKTVFDFGEQLEQKSYGLLDLSSSFDYADKFSIRLWAKNVTDERHQIYRINVGGTDIASYGQPRTFGLDIISTF